MNLTGIQQREPTHQERAYLAGARKPAATLVHGFCKAVGWIAMVYCTIAAIAAVLRVAREGGSLLAPAIWLLFGAAILWGMRAVNKNAKLYATAVNTGTLTVADGICLGVSERTYSFHPKKGELPEHRWYYYMEVQLTGASGQLSALISPATHKRAVVGEQVLVVSNDHFKTGKNLQAYLLRDIEHCRPQRH